MKKKSWTFFIGCMISTMLVLSSCKAPLAIDLIQSTPENTIRNYFKYISSEEYDKAFRLLKNPYKASKGENVEEFASMFDLSRRHGTVWQGVTIYSTQHIDESNALVSFKIELQEKGQPVKADAKFTLELDTNDGKWYIIDSVN
jgi:hypothetical protein